jgi:hypothetical protein
MITPATYAAVACICCGRIPDASKGEQIYGVAADDPVRYCSQTCLQADAATHQLEVRAVEAFTALRYRYSKYQHLLNHTKHYIMPLIY